MVNAPMAVGLKELKISTIGARAIRFVFWHSSQLTAPDSPQP